MQDGRWISSTVKKFTVEIQGDKSTGYVKLKDSSGNALLQTGYADFSSLKAGDYKIEAFGVDTQGREVFSVSTNVYIGSSQNKYCTIYTKSRTIRCKNQ